MANPLGDLLSGIDKDISNRRKNLKKTQIKLDNARLWVAALGAAISWAILGLLACILFLVYWPKIFVGTVAVFCSADLVVELILVTQRAAFLFGAMLILLIFSCIFWKIREFQLSKEFAKRKAHLENCLNMNGSGAGRTRYNVRPAFLMEDKDGE